MTRRTWRRAIRGISGEKNERDLSPSLLRTLLLTQLKESYQNSNELSTTRTMIALMQWRMRKSCSYLFIKLQ